MLFRSLVAVSPPVAANPIKARQTVPSTLDITNLPETIFVDHPGLDNAVANDGKDDAATIQTVLKWLDTNRSQSQATTIYIPEGVFDLAKTIRVTTANVTFQGANQERTVLRPSRSFKVGTQRLPDGETVFEEINQNAYLFAVKDDANNTTFESMTMRGANIHGAIFSGRNNGLNVNGLELNNFLWSSIRLFEVRNAKIYNNVLIDAGGQSEGNSGITGGAIFATYLKNSEIYKDRKSVV